MLRRVVPAAFWLSTPSMLVACDKAPPPVMAPIASASGAPAPATAPAQPTLCDATPHILSGLRGSLQLDVYYARGTPTLTRFQRDLEALLTRMAATSNERMTFRFIETGSEAGKEAAKDAGLVMQTFGEMANADAALITRGYSGVVFHYGREMEVLKYLPPDGIEGVELWLDMKLREIVARADVTKYRIGVVTGHRERSLADEKLMPGTPMSMAKLFSQYYPMYELESVDITRGDPDPGLAGVLLMQPEGDLDDASLARLDAFVMRGRALVIAASSANVQEGDASLTVTLKSHRLNKLLTGYGITLHEDVVLDTDNAWSINTTSGMVKLPYIPVIQGDGDDAKRKGLETRTSVFFRLNQHAFPFASSLAIDRSKQPAATFTTLATSGERTQSSPTMGPLWPLTPREKPGMATPGPATLAVQVQGPLTSAFGRQQSQPGARVLMLASSWAFANPFWSADASRTPTAGPVPGALAGAVGTEYAQAHMVQNILVMKNMLDWASDADLSRCGLPAHDAGATRSTGTSGDKR